MGTDDLSPLRTSVLYTEQIPRVTCRICLLSVLCGQTKSEEEGGGMRRTYRWIVTVVLAIVSCIGTVPKVYAAPAVSAYEADVGIQQSFQWAKGRGAIRDTDYFNSEAPCTKEHLLKYLFRLGGSVALQDEHIYVDVVTEEQRQICAWSRRVGLLGDTTEAGLAETLDRATALGLIYKACGTPLVAETGYSFANVRAEDLAAVNWAADYLLIQDVEVEGYDLYTTCTEEDAITYLYYTYNIRPKRRFPITRAEFLMSCQNVVDTARIYGYSYGSSGAWNPTTDGVISCDRMVAKALYDLGYTDQIQGGEVCDTLDDYLMSHGFLRSTSLADAKAGSIMLVKHQGEYTITHVFVCASDFDLATMTADRYDCGSDVNIQSVQPLRGKGFWYRTDDVIVYNIPE